MARPRSFDEQVVLDAAMRQFRRTGYAGTTLDDISTATGLGRGSLYSSFEGKHPLFLRTLDRYVEQTLATLEEKLSGPDEAAAERLRSYLLIAARRVAEDVDHTGCMGG